MNEQTGTAYQCWTCGQAVPIDQAHECPGKAGPRPGTGWLDGIGTVRACIDCGVLVAGGPTRCIPCAQAAPGLLDVVRIAYTSTTRDILISLSEESAYQSDGSSGATSDELANLLSLAGKEITKLRENQGHLLSALTAVEWVSPGHDVDEIGYCPWCHWNENIGHRPGCLRQAMLSQVGETT